MSAQHVQGAGRGTGRGLHFSNAQVMGDVGQRSHEHDQAGSDADTYDDEGNDSNGLH